MQGFGHLFDVDAVCVDCGFDGAEWEHYRSYRPDLIEAGKPACEKPGRPNDQYLESNNGESFEEDDFDMYGDSDDFPF